VPPLPHLTCTPLNLLSSYGSAAQIGPWPPLLGFCNNNLFYGAGLLGQHPTRNLEDQASVFITLETGWPSYTPRHWVPILVVFCDMHGLQWNYSLISATTRDISNVHTGNCIVQVHILLSEILKTEKLRKPKVFQGGRLHTKARVWAEHALLSRILKQGVMCRYCMYMYRCTT
jgi:hypothetical protein